MRALDASRRDRLTALLLTGPVLFFPFTRGYYIFYVVLLAFGLWSLVRSPDRDFVRRLGAMTAAIVLPLLASVVGRQDGLPAVQASAILVPAVAFFMAYGAATLVRDASPAATNLIGWLITFSVSAWVLGAVAQLVWGMDLYSLKSTAFAVERGRITSFFTSPTKFGYYLAPFGLISMFFLLEQGRKWMPWVLALAFAVMTALSGSRYGLMMLLVGLAIFLVVYVRRHAPGKLIPIGVGALGTGVLAFVVLMTTSAAFNARVLQTVQGLLHMDYQSWNLALTYRLDVWEPTVRLIGDHWLFGVGPGVLAEVVGSYLPPESYFIVHDIKILNAHQIVLEVLVAAGVIGLVGFLAMYFWLCVFIARLPKGMGYGFLLAFVLLWLPFGTQRDFYASEMMLNSFFLIGLGLGLVARSGVQSPRQHDDAVA